MTVDDDFRAITGRVHVNLPFGKINDRIADCFIRQGLNPEIGINHEVMTHYGRNDFTGMAERFLAAGLKMTVHCPFNEIFPGSPDPLIRKASRERLDGVFGILPLFRPRAAVMHLNYEERRFRFVYDAWISHIVPAVKHYAELCGKIGAVLSVENVYEEDPRAMADLFGRLKGYPVQHCLDVGHLNAFSETGLEEWLSLMGPFIGHFHLHDNDGTGDHHLPIGAGNVDFSRVSRFIREMDREPLITLEPHREEHLRDTLRGFAAAGLLQSMEKSGEK